MKHKTYMANEYWDDYRQKQPKVAGKLHKICNFIKTILAEMFEVILWTLVTTSPSHF